MCLKLIKWINYQIENNKNEYKKLKKWVFQTQGSLKL
jgi:hypothetical protein